MAVHEPGVEIPVGDAKPLQQRHKTRVSERVEGEEAGVDRHNLAAHLDTTLLDINIAHFDINGAAVATIISQVAAAYLFDAAHRKTRITFRMKTRSLMLYQSLPALLRQGGRVSRD